MFVGHLAIGLVAKRIESKVSLGTWVLAALFAVFGLGLWNSLPATLQVEGGFWLLSVILYVRTTQAKSHVAHFVFWIGIVLLTLLWFGDLNAGMDPNPIKAGVGGLIIFSVVVAWAYWIDRVRATHDRY